VNPVKGRLQELTEGPADKLNKHIKQWAIKVWMAQRPTSIEHIAKYQMDYSTENPSKEGTETDKQAKWQIL